VQLHGVRRAATQRDGRAVELVASALIATLDHKQRWHDEIPVGKPADFLRRESVWKSFGDRPYAAASRLFILRISGP
jgi:hypothetical protein